MTDNDTVSTQQSQDSFVACIKEHLDASEQQLPSHVVSRLRQARQNALAQQQSRFGKWRELFDVTRHSLFHHPWIASCASILTVALLVGYLQTQPTAEEKLQAMDAEAEILFAEEDLELYEDLEFYRWLANTGY